VVRAAFAKVEAEVGASGYLAGDSFTVADLTAASILSVLVVPPEFPYIHLQPDERPAPFREFRASLMETPGFRWVEEMYARHRGTSAEVGA
jgi:glutathione S-transferase